MVSNISVRPRGQAIPVYVDIWDRRHVKARLGDITHDLSCRDPSVYDEDQSCFPDQAKLVCWFEAEEGSIHVTF